VRTGTLSGYHAEMGKINRRVNITAAVCSNAVILPEVTRDAGFIEVH
jgi:hypothetical protein